MFLDERLEAIYNATTENAEQMVYSLLNACVHNIAEKTYVGMRSKDCANIIKQTNNSWILFCKKHDLQGFIELFEKAYINERIKKHPQLKNFF